MIVNAPNAHVRPNRHIIPTRLNMERQVPFIFSDFDMSLNRLVLVRCLTTIKITTRNINMLSSMIAKIGPAKAEKNTIVLLVKQLGNKKKKRYETRVTKTASNIQVII